MVPCSLPPSFALVWAASQASFLYSRNGEIGPSDPSGRQEGIPFFVSGVKMLPVSDRVDGFPDNGIFPNALFQLQV